MKPSNRKYVPLLALLSLAAASCDLFLPKADPTYLLEQSSGYYTPNGQGDRSDGLVGLADLAAGAEDAASAASASAPVEPDLYYLDATAKLLYAANSYRGLVAFDVADADKPALAGRCAVLGQPKELYAHGDEIVLLCDPSCSYGYGIANRASESPAAAKSAVAFIGKSVFSGAAAEPVRVELGGSILDSRLVGDSLIVATNEGWVSAPQANDSGTASSSDIGSFSAAIRIVDLDSRAVSTYRVEGSCTAIHVAADAVFVALQTGYWGSYASTLVRFDMGADGSLAERGRVDIRGYVSDRFKLDWRGGSLRVVSHDAADWRNRVTRAFSIDWGHPDAPVSHEATALELAAGESLWASRFDGDLAYIVTFFTTDPLFVVSFADSAAPEKLGELEVPGYSTHIEALTAEGGEKLLFAVGVEGGRTKTSIFDVSDPAYPVEKGSPLLLGDTWSWSAANGDWKRINRLPQLGAFALPYYHYDSRGGEFRVALVSCQASGPSLLCELPDSGDTERTIPVENDLVYTYAVDRLQSWRISGAGAVRTAELDIVEDVAWATELGGAGIKILRSGDKVSVRSFAPGSFDDTGCLSRIDLPATSDAGDQLWYPLDGGSIAVLPVSGLGDYMIFVLAQGWNRVGSNTATLFAVRVGADLSLELDPAALSVAAEGHWGPPPSKSSPRIIGAEAGRLYLFHGDFSVVDAEAWPNSVTIPCSDGVEAIPYGGSVALFSWKDSDLRGYGRMNVEFWDMGGAAPARLSGPSSFPGYPLWRSSEGLWISAYEPAYWLDETRLLAVKIEEGKALVVDEIELEGRIGDWRDAGPRLALLTGQRLRYWLARPADSAERAKSAPASRDASAQNGLYAARIADGALKLDLLGPLQGWPAALVGTAPGEEPRRLAAASSEEALICAPADAGLSLLRREALDGGSWWNSPGLSFGGGWLWLAQSYRGIERLDAR